MAELPKSEPLSGSGGTEGGVGMFMGGFALAATALWFFFDSVLMARPAWPHEPDANRFDGRHLAAVPGRHFRLD